MWFVLSKQLLQYLLEHSHQLSQMCQMSNIWHIWHIKLQNMSFIRCFICAIFLKHTTVRSQIWERTVYLYHNLYYFFILAGPLPLSPHSFTKLYLLSLSLHFFALSLYSTSLPPSLTKPRPKYQATPHHTNPTYTLISSSTNTATQTRPTTSTTTHGLITMPHHAAEHVVPSTTSSEPPTIGLLSIGLQWWVLLLGLFDLGCEFVWFDCVFCHADLFSCVWYGFCFWVCLIWGVGLFDLIVFFAVPIFLVVFDVGFAFGFSFWRWWMWVCAGGGCRCCCGGGGCAVVVVDDDEDDRE